MKSKLFFGCLFLVLTGLASILFLSHLRDSLSVTQSVMFPSLVSGDIKYLPKTSVSHAMSAKPLDKEQLKVIAGWLEKHKDKWGSVFETPPLCKEDVILKHWNGQVTSLCFLNKNTIWLSIFKKDSDSSKAPEGGIQSFSDQDLQPLFDSIKDKNFSF